MFEKRGEVHCNYVCVGWREDAEDMFGYDVDYDYNYGIRIPTDEGNVQGVKDEWMDDGSAETWADQMNWIGISKLKIKMANMCLRGSRRFNKDEEVLRLYPVFLYN